MHLKHAHVHVIFPTALMKMRVHVYSEIILGGAGRIFKTLHLITIYRAG